jgi:exopolyphosphatase/guanosine-5'-triphosphate,3'-diphosphate pyrophosphatase
MKGFIKTHTKGLSGLQIIGSGGNINKIFAMSKVKEGKPLTAAFIRKLHTEMEFLSLHERMNLYNLREDRAAVIVPALHIFTHIIKWTGNTEIFVPKIGLADGIIKKLHHDIEMAVGPTPMGI